MRYFGSSLAAAAIALMAASALANEPVPADQAGQQQPTQADASQPDHRQAAQQAEEHRRQALERRQQMMERQLQAQQAQAKQSQPQPQAGANIPSQPQQAPPKPGALAAESLSQALQQIRTAAVLYATQMAQEIDTRDKRIAELEKMCPQAAQQPAEGQR